MVKKTFDPKPYVIVGVVCLIAPLIIYVFLGNFYQHLSLCENPLQQEVYIGGNLVNCTILRLITIAVPLFLIISVILLLYASARKLRR